LSDLATTDVHERDAVRFARCSRSDGAKRFDRPLVTVKKESAGKRAV